MGIRRRLEATRLELTALYRSSPPILEHTRRLLYGRSAGLRMVILHDVPRPGAFRWFERLVAFCEANFEIAGPDDVTALGEGRLAPSQRDRLMFSFDDGYADNFEAAERLAARGIRAMFFVVPSFVGRSSEEYCELHRRNGIDAVPFFLRPCRGLDPSQIREMAAMGHRIGGHNYSHRDLGVLHDAEDFRYEIQRSLDEIGEILGRPCEDFAWGFGRPENVSPEAAAYLRERCPRIYSASRGLNMPGRSPRLFLRDEVRRDQPFRFTRMALRAGIDAFSAPEWTALERLGGRCPPYDPRLKAERRQAAQALPSAP